MKRLLSIITVLSVLSAFIVIPNQAFADDPFENIRIGAEDSNNGNGIALETIDTLADISDANKRGSESKSGDSSDGASDKKTFKEILGAGKSDSSDSSKNDSGSKKTEGGTSGGTVRNRIDSTSEKSKKMVQFTNKYMKREDDVDITDDIFDDNIIHPEDAESFREFNLNEEKRTKPESFSGSYKESRGSDGSVTYLYDSGTILTKKPDGTCEGFDYTGRRLTGDKDGAIITHCSDDSQFKVYSDGRREFYDKSDDTRTEFYDNGTYTTFYKDGSRTECNEDGSGTHINPTGLRYDFAEDGSDNNVYYFEGGESVKVTDDKDNLIIGERSIKGPNGEKFTFSNTIDFNKELKDGETFEGKCTITCVGNGNDFHSDMYVKQSDNEDILTVDRKSVDGSTAKVDSRSEKDESGNSDGYFNVSCVSADGSTIDFNMNSTEKSSGEENTELTFTVRDADGSAADINFDSNTDINGNTTTQGTGGSKDADGSYTNFSISGTEDKDGNSTDDCKLEIHDADGSDLKMDYSEKKNADGTGSVDVKASSYNAETGAKGDFEASGDGDDSTLSFKETDADGKEISLEMNSSDKADTDKIVMKEKDTDGTEKSMDLDVDLDNKTATAVRDDGSYFKISEDGSKVMEDKLSGSYIKTNENDDITACHLVLPNTKSSFDFKDGTGVLVDETSGEKVMWTRDENGKLLIASPSTRYSVDKDGNLYHNGKPVRFNGDWVNVDTGINPDATEEQTDAPTEEVTEESTEPTTEPPTEEPTDPPTEPETTVQKYSLDRYLGTWRYSSKKQSYTCNWTFEEKGEMLYLIISGYSSDNDKMALPCTYELSENSMKISCAVFDATVTPVSQNVMNVETQGVDGDTAVLKRQ